MWCLFFMICLLQLEYFGPPKIQYFWKYFLHTVLYTTCGMSVLQQLFFSCPAGSQMSDKDKIVKTDLIEQRHNVQISPRGRILARIFQLQQSLLSAKKFSSAHQLAKRLLRDRPIRLKFVFFDLLNVFWRLFCVRRLDGSGGRRLGLRRGFEK